MQTPNEIFQEAMEEPGFNDFVYSMIDRETVHRIVEEACRTQLVYDILRELLLIEVESQIDKIESTIALNRMEHPDAHQNIDRIILLKEKYLHC